MVVYHNDVNQNITTNEKLYAVQIKISFRQIRLNNLTFYDCF